MLDELHTRGIRIVHLIPSGTAQTIPVYDTFVAKPLNDTDRDLLTKRSTYWPLTKAGELAVMKMRRSAAPCGARCRGLVVDP
jgi:hypothetical protein